jgi:hypothetical protein
MAEATTLTGSCCFTRHVLTVTDRTLPKLSMSKRLQTFAMF